MDSLDETSFNVEQGHRTDDGNYKDDPDDSDVSDAIKTSEGKHRRRQIALVISLIMYIILASVAVRCYHTYDVSDEGSIDIDKQRTDQSNIKLMKSSVRQRQYEKDRLYAESSFGMPTSNNNDDKKQKEQHVEAVERPRTPEIAWLMSFPNSGTSFTMGMVGKYTSEYVCFIVLYSSLVLSLTYFL
jgi:hypothetical protein